VMSPAEVAEDDVPVVGVVVVVVGGAVVVVVGGVEPPAGGVVVVVEALPPPVAPLAPPAEPPPLVSTLLAPPALPLVVVVGFATGMTTEPVDQRFTSPENWLLLDSEARVKTTSDRTALESLPPNAEAEASMLTNATKTNDDTARVAILGMRCEVLTEKKF